MLTPRSRSHRERLEVESQIGTTMATFSTFYDALFLIFLSSALPGYRKSAKSEAYSDNTDFGNEDPSWKLD